MYQFTPEELYHHGYRFISRCCETCRWYAYDDSYGDYDCASLDSIQCCNFPEPDFCCEYWEASEDATWNL